MKEYCIKGYIYGLISYSNERTNTIITSDNKEIKFEGDLE